MAIWDSPFSMLSPGGIGALGFGRLPTASWPGTAGYGTNPTQAVTSPAPGVATPAAPAGTPWSGGGGSLGDMAMKLLQMGQPHPLGGQPGQAMPQPPMQGPQQSPQLMQYLAQMLQGRGLGTQPAQNLWAELMRRQGFGGGGMMG